MTPVRIQRRRAKGWKMPENTVSVTRPGKYGNPFKVGMPIVDCAFIVVKNAKLTESEQKGGIVTPEIAVRFYEIWLQKHIGSHVMQATLENLRGKNLACFCPLNQPCHADVLLKIANQ